MPEFSCRLHGPALQRAPGDDACAKTRRCLEHQQIVVRLAIAASFGEGDDVGVVVENDRRIGEFGEIGR